MTFDVLCSNPKSPLMMFFMWKMNPCAMAPHFCAVQRFQSSFSSIRSIDFLYACTFLHSYNDGLNFKSYPRRASSWGQIWLMNYFLLVFVIQIEIVKRWLIKVILPTQSHLKQNFVCSMANFWWEKTRPILLKSKYIQNPGLQNVTSHFTMWQIISFVNCLEERLQFIYPMFDCLIKKCIDHPLYLGTKK